MGCVDITISAQTEYVRLSSTETSEMGEGCRDGGGGRGWDGIGMGSRRGGGNIMKPNIWSEVFA